MSPDELDHRVGRLEAAQARLEGAMERVQVDVARLVQMPIDLARFGERVAALESSMSRFDAALGEIKGLIRSEQHERREETNERERERKSDRRWLVGTVLSSTALIITAVGLLLGGP